MTNEEIDLAINKQKVEKLPIKFKEFALENGISLDYEPDWKAWFECWEDGYNTGAEEWNDN